MQSDKPDWAPVEDGHIDNLIDISQVHLPVLAAQVARGGTHVRLAAAVPIIGQPR